MEDMCYVCVFYYCRTYYKAVRVGGGGEWRTCATRDDEPRPVWSRRGVREGACIGGATMPQPWTLRLTRLNRSASELLVCDEDRIIFKKNPREISNLVVGRTGEVDP